MKKIVYTVLFLFITSMSAKAYVDNQFMTSEQALINEGYSGEMSRLINHAKIDPYSAAENIDEKSAFEKFYNYLDPAKGTNNMFPGHRIKFDSSWRDY